MKTTPKILVIEDQPSIHDLLAIFFEKKGCATLWVETGQEGIRLAKEEKPAAVLIDVHLPDMGGLDVLRAIKSFDKKAKLFLFSGLYNEDEKVEALACGGEGFIDKAKGVDAIIQTVCSSLGLT
jgi:DNA-binding response OmpR family regulator